MHHVFVRHVAVRKYDLIDRVAPAQVFQFSFLCNWNAVRI